MTRRSGHSRRRSSTRRANFAAYLNQIDVRNSQRIDEIPECCIVQLAGMQDRACGFDRFDLAELFEQIQRHWASNSDVVRRFTHVRLDQ